MTTATIVASPNIQGDISVCRTEKTVLNGYKRDSLWYSEDIGYMTNNCTGHTDVYTSWSLTGTSAFVIGVVGILVLLWGMRILADY